MEGASVDEQLLEILRVRYTPLITKIINDNVKFFVFVKLLNGGSDLMSMLLFLHTVIAKQKYLQ